MASMLSLLFQYLHNLSSDLSMLHYLFILILTTLFLIFIFPHTTTIKAKPSNPNSALPPSPLSLPLLGHMHRLGNLPFRSLQKLSSQYGPIMYLRLGCVPAVVLSSASVVEEAVRFHEMAILSRPRMSAADILLYDSTDVGFSPYGEYWRQARRISMLHLLSAKRVQSFRVVREQEVSLLIDRIHSASSSRSECDGVVNLSRLLIKLSNDIVCRAAFGCKYSSDETGTFSNLLRELFFHLGTPPIAEHVPCLGWFDRFTGTKKRMRKTAQGLDSFLENVIEEHVKAREDALRDGKDGDQMEVSDLVDVLLNVQENDEEIGISLSRNNIKAIILFKICRICLLLAQKQCLQQWHGQDEVRGLISAAGKLTEELIEKMTYLNAAIKEALRLHPPVPLLMPRESTKDIELLGYHIPAGTRFIINAWAIGRDTSSWERADEFFPERFLGSNLDYKGQHFRLIPFGTGRRICPGIGFATATIGFALASLLHHFDWNLPDRMKGKPLDMSELNGLSVRKKVDLVMEAKPHLI